MYVRILKYVCFVSFFGGLVIHLGFLVICVVLVLLTPLSGMTVVVLVIFCLFAVLPVAAKVFVV